MLHGTKANGVAEAMRGVGRCTGTPVQAVVSTWVVWHRYQRQFAPLWLLLQCAARSLRLP